MDCVAIDAHRARDYKAFRSGALALCGEFRFADLGRLRHAIAAEDGDEEEQLNGVLRMLGAESPDKNQLLLFGKAPGSQAPKP